MTDQPDYTELRWTTNVPIKRKLRRIPPDPVAPPDPPPPERPTRRITSTLPLRWPPRFGDDAA